MTDDVEQRLHYVQIDSEAGCYKYACEHYEQAAQMLLDRNQALEERIQEQRRDFDEKYPGLIGKTEALKAENQALKKEKEELVGRNESLQDELNKESEQLRSCTEEFQGLRREKQELIDRNKTLQDELDKMTDQLSRSTERLKKARREREERPVRERQEWLKGLTELSYSGEIEVEVKFIHPLVKYLGYREDDFSLRHSVKVRVGRGEKRGQADWVLWDRSKLDHVARAVIEAKAPNQRLDNEVQDQTRSYAFALGAPVYALTDGKRLKVFRFGVRGDECIVNCNVERLGEYWPRIDEAMGIGPLFPETTEPETTETAYVWSVLPGRTRTFRSTIEPTE